MESVLTVFWWLKEIETDSNLEKFSAQTLAKHSKNHCIFFLDVILAQCLLLCYIS